MANLWNPLAPGILGNEWLPVIGQSNPVAQSKPSFVQRLRSRSAETITSLRMAVASNPAVTDRIFTVMDVIPAGSEVPGALQVVEYPPILDETIGNWTTNLGGVTNLFARIDDAVVYPPVGTDYIRQIVGGNSAYRCSVDSSGFPSTARVLRVSIAAVIGVVSLPGTAFVELNLFHEPSATPYSAPGSIVFTNGLVPNAVTYIDCGEINPVTLLPWSPADIQSFDSGDWHLRVAGAGTGSNGPIVTAMALRVSYVDPDNRAAVGTWRRPSGSVSTIVSTDALVRLSAGAWTANWSKPASGDFSFLWRWGRDKLVGGSAPVANDIAWLTAYQDLGEAGNPAGISYPPVPGMVADTLAVDEHGLPTEAFVGDLRRAGRLVLRLAASDSDDSQPYRVNFSTDVLKTLDSSTPVGQRISPAASNSYIGVRTVVQPPASTDGTLTIRIFGVVSGLQIGTGQFTITADEVRALPEIAGSGMRYVEGFLNSAAALVSGTQYEIRMTVDAGTWTVIVPYCDSGNGSSSFGGTTDIARIGGVSFSDSDAMLSVLIQPTAPATATAKVQETPLQNEGSLCSVTSFDTVLVDWSSTALTSAFARYEIERWEDDDEGWKPVHHVTSAESLSQWVDREAKRNRPVKYRVRVVANTTAVSAWTETGFVTPESRDSEVIFTSNEDNSLEVAYDYDPQYSIGFLDHEADEIVPLYGVDFQVAFMEPEDRGISKNLRLTVNVLNGPCDDTGRPLADDEVWEPLRAISRAPNIPYVCVLDAKGNRMYAHLRLNNGSGDGDGNLYFVDAILTPMTDTPAVGTS